MSDLIFGYDWNDIKAMQQKTYSPPKIKETPRQSATEEDLKLFNEIGLEGLEKKQFYGVIGRLKNSGII